MREDWLDSKIEDAICLKKDKYKPNETAEEKFYIGLEHIEKNSGRISSEVSIVPINTVKNSFSIGDILYGKLRPYLNKVHLCKKDGVCSTDILVFKPGKCVLDKYVLNYMLSRRFVNDMTNNTSGVNLPRVSTKYVLNYRIPLPPLPEQRAILAKIEELFSSLDSGIADLQKAQAQLKVFKLSVLSNVSKGSKKATLDEVIDNLTQGWSPKCINQSSADPEEWAVIKTSAIQSNEFREVENKILPTTLEPRTQHEIQVGDILITRAGPRVRVGVCCLVKKTRPKLINSDKVYRIRVDKSKILPEFLEYSLNAPENLKEIEKMKSGSSDSGLNLTQTRFLSLEISLPSIKEQLQIVQEIESRLSVCDKVEESILENLEKAKALRQSILKKAFAGKLLTEQELAACKAAPDYEPASVLLERIKAKKK